MTIVRTMSRILEFESQCIRYLHSLNDCFTANPNIVAVHKYALGEKFGFGKILTDRIVKFLLNKGALRGAEGESIKITPSGIDQLIAYEREGHKALATSNFNVNVGSMNGSNIIQGSQGVSITTVLTQTQSAEVGKIISALRDIVLAPELTEEKKAELNVEIQTLEIQLKAPKPKLERIKDCLISAKNILEGSAIGLAVVSRIAAFFGTLG